MAEIINMPRLSDTMEEGTLAKWFKKVGDSVKEGEILAEIETDKATMEFESFHDGVLLHIGIDEGSTASVDSIIAVIGSKGEDISSIIKGVNAAKSKGFKVIGLSGFDGGALKDICDISIHLPVHNYGVVEDGHSAILTILVQYISNIRDNRI